MRPLVAGLLAALISYGSAVAAPLDIATDYLRANHRRLGLTAQDIAEAAVIAHYTTRHNGVTHVSFQQQLGGIDVFAGVLKVNITRDGRILSVSNRFVSNLTSRALLREPKVTAAEAVNAAAAALGRGPLRALRSKEEVGGSSRKVVFAASGVSTRDIPVRLVYLPRGKGPVRLAWDLAIETDQEHYWQIQVDAGTGQVLQRKNYVLNHSYKVYPLPVESPDHIAPTPPEDGRALTVDPEAAGPSPFGWVETLFTDGPNVRAQTDLDANDVFTPGTDIKPMGTGLPTALVFDQPIDLTMSPTTYREALVTNLFYWNNVLHDVHELYGFDEASANFEGNDAVLADAQDGSGTNNANMLTLPDGVPPRMQMFIFTPPAALQVNAPFSASYGAGSAGFGQPLDEAGVTGDLVIVDDGAGTSNDACEPPPWNSNVTGKIAFLDRGTCEFGTKILHAEQAGAVAAVLVNIQNDEPVGMGPGADGGQVTIPSVSIGNANGDTIKASIDQGNTVNVTMRAGAQPRDSDFDNGFIIHEYGHGVSNRLTGDGVLVPFCLSLDGDQQAGEGWSDWWALAFTQLTGTEAPGGRGIGTYVSFQDTTGLGIRPFRYSSDMTVNPQTYGDLATGTLSIPHGVGTVWATAIWDMYWALVRGVPSLGLPARGFEPDIYKFDSGKGNTLALQLVMDGLKLQGCMPNMLDARDAILTADRENNAGANQCHIWWAFARRGMGVNAASDGTTLDVTEDFSRPFECQAAGGCEISPSFSGADAVVAPADGDCRLVVRWSAARDNCATGELRYDLYRSTDPLFVPGAGSLLAENLTGLEYTDTAVQSGVEYFYVVRARDGLGNAERNLARPSNVPVGGFSDDPDGLTDDAGDTEQHFSAAAGQQSFGWHVRASGGAGGSKVHATSLSGNYSDDSCLFLESEILYLGASPTLSFQSTWDIEIGFDGGIVEISTEAGGFSDWTKLDDILYPGVLVPDTANIPCSPGLADGERVFTGTSNGNFLTFSSDLSPWANQTVKLRFAFGSDGSTTAAGWFIDDITIDEVRSSEDCVSMENLPPAASDDSASTKKNRPVTIDVLANDSDPEGDTLTVVNVTQPANGSAANDGNGTVTYAPGPGFAGSDGFSDGHGNSASAGVSVTVTRRGP